MALDTTTPSLGLLLQGTGNNNNSWGDNLNKFVFEYLEKAVAGLIVIAVDGGTDNLTADQARYGTIHFDGALSAKQVIVVDNVPKRWTVGNFTTGDFVLHMKTAAGDPVSIPQGTVKQIYCDGDDNLIRMDRDKVGTIIQHGGTTAPSGTLVCSGGTYVRADLPELFEEIGETWGAGNGATTAGLPNLTDTNRFLRAAGGDLAVGTYQASQNKVHSHTASATTTVSASGSTSTDGNHVHNNYLNDPGHTHGVYGGIYGGTTSLPYSLNDSDGPGNTDLIRIQGAYTGITISNAAGGSHYHSVTVTGTAATTVTIQSDGGPEARPESAAVMMCIVI